ncbi:MAG: GspE/PulE family protein [Bacteroidota bacterium]
MEPTLQELDFRLISLLTAEQAHTFRIIPLRIEEKKLIALGETSSRSKLPQLQLVLGKSVELEIIPPDHLQRLLLTHYPIVQASQNQSQSTSVTSESDTVRFVTTMMEEAANMEASDIHIERYENEARIRFRWEGQLVEKYEVPIERYNAVVSRIKILADLDISERRLPQDGRIHFQHMQTDIDLRVSTIPGKFGEKVVMRLLTRSEEHLNIDNVGLSAEELSLYRQAIHRPNGIILITGPTGSGKTTTLYATLNQLNQPEKNILTIEDPIEYNLTGINQVQLKEDIGLSFDRALRAFLRQDPDIIMVGEIRDTSTAQIAIRAALTGHLVFSTLHTNSAWDAITRLVDMGIEPYLLAASLRLLVAQRLIRLLCPHCKSESHELVSSEFQEMYNIRTHHVPVGCPSCHFTGYKGRKAVFELIKLTPELKELVKSGQGNAKEISARQSLPSLEESLAQQVLHGWSSLEEALMHVEI